MPIVLLTGNIGEFVGPIGVSVILALVSSLFVSMTVVPASDRHLRRGRRRDGPPPLVAGRDREPIAGGGDPSGRRCWRRGGRRSA